MANVRLPIVPSEEQESSGRLVDQSSLPAPSVASDGDEVAKNLMQVGDLARETGRTVRAIHLYEELGLLSPAGRSKGRYRLYAPDSLVRIRWIGQLQEMGFSLGDIQTVVREWERIESAPGATRRMREVYARKLEETRAQRRRLEQLEHEIEASIGYLDTCAAVCDPARLVTACKCCDLHEKHAPATHPSVPDLVRGFRAQPPQPPTTPATIVSRSTKASRTWSE
jgi:MerR family copper efflux transcriptional regulator